MLRRWRSTVEQGRWAERLVARTLRRRGYRILERNYRCARGEIDLIAASEDVLCFVEVKARSREDYGGAIAAVDDAKRRRVVAAAEVYLAETGYCGICRFDVVTLAARPPGRWHVDHLENAFEAGSGGSSGGR